MVTTPPTNAHEYTVSQLSRAVKSTVEDEFGHVRVRGEVGRLSRPASGHLYFDLKDDKSVLAAVAWKGVAARWRFQPEQGLEVIATGRLTTFAGQSKYQIIVEQVEPAGAGALMALLEERRRKLAAEGLFEAAHKQKLPFLPRVIGVVTSPTGAVIRDILHRLSDRFPANVIVWPVRVQGPSCAPEVAAAVEGLNMLPPDGPISRPDLIIVARGGGSVEDLWGFNEEEVVRAIAQSAIPVISAIGHETDTTLADFAADQRAPTPTGAAEMAVPVRSELVATVRDLDARLYAASRRLLDTLADRLRASAGRLPRPDELLATPRQRLDLAATRLGAALNSALQAKALQLAAIAPRLSAGTLVRGLEQQRQMLNGLAGRMVRAASAQIAALNLKLSPPARRLQPAIVNLLETRRTSLERAWQMVRSLGYRNVLKRGFVLVSDEKGKIVREAARLKGGQIIGLEFADGQRHARVLPAAGQAGAPEKGTTGPKEKPAAPESGQKSLFD